MFALAVFPLLDTKNYFLMWVALGGCLALMGPTYGPMAAFLPELFATRYRYSGAALAYAEDVPSSVELRWRSGEHQAALTC